MTDLIRKGDALDAMASTSNSDDMIHAPVLRAAIAALPAVTVGVEWRNIETAPRGGEWFIARTEHGTTRVVRYADEYDRFPISHDGVVWPTAPTEWTPLKPVLAALKPVAEPTPASTMRCAECDCQNGGGDCTWIKAAPDPVAINEVWRKNSRETFEAMVAMRDSINEYIPMPSLESDLLQGPENSVFCATVAGAVIAEIRRLRAALESMGAPDLAFDPLGDYFEGIEEGIEIGREEALREAAAVAKGFDMNPKLTSPNAVDQTARDIEAAILALIPKGAAE